MSRRLQSLGGDKVLEITETQPVKRRLSEKALVREREALEQAIAKYQGRLAVVAEQIQLIHDEERNAGGRG